MRRRKPSPAPKTSTSARQRIIDLLEQGSPHNELKKACAIACAYALRDIPPDDAIGDGRGSGARAAESITRAYKNIVDMTVLTKEEAKSTSLRTMIRQLAEVKTTTTTPTIEEQASEPISTQNTAKTPGITWDELQAANATNTTIPTKPPKKTRKPLKITEKPIEIHT